MKKVLVSGYIGFDNFGDEAIFYALSSHLKDKNFKVSVLCNNSLNVAQKYGVETFRYKNIFDILIDKNGKHILLQMQNIVNYLAFNPMLLKNISNFSGISKNVPILSYCII